MRVVDALGGEPPDVVFECAGNPAAPALAAELVRSRGIIVLLGVLEEPVPINQLVLLIKEAQMRASFTARQQARAGRREKGQQGDESLPLPDRLDRASERMAKRAEQVKAFADVIRPFYASLTDDQKAVANVVLGQGRSDRGFRGRHWTMNRGPGADQD